MIFGRFLGKAILFDNEFVFSFLFLKNFVNLGTLFNDFELAYSLYLTPSVCIFHSMNENWECTLILTSHVLQCIHFPLTSLSITSLRLGISPDFNFLIGILVTVISFGTLNVYEVKIYKKVNGNF